MVALLIAEEAAYTSFYTAADYPIQKVLRDPIYVQINIVERSDPNIVLKLGHCWATSSPNPQSLPQWDLLVDGYKSTPHSAVRFCCYSVMTSNSRLQVSLQWGLPHHQSRACGLLLRT